MTLAPSFGAAAEAPPADAAREDLERIMFDPRIQRIIRGLVRRRVAADDVDDVVQHTYCDALAATHYPPPHELAGWLIGIARHKTIDYLRSRRRNSSVGVDSDGVDELAQAPASFEARDLLARVAREEGAAARSRETLSWLVREHEGEALSAIAAKDEVPPDVVRQRVSRMRRALRARWGAAIVAMLLGSASLAEWQKRHPTEIVADSIASGIVVSTMAGDWTIDSLSLGDGFDAASRTALAAEATLARVRVQDNRVAVVTPTSEHSYRLEWMPSSGVARAHIVDEQGHVRELELRSISPDRVLLDLTGARSARLVLVRSPAAR